MSQESSFLTTLRKSERGDESNLAIQNQSPQSDSIEVLQDGDLVFARVASKRFPNRKYNVFYNRTDGRASCECDGYFNHEKCWHVMALKAKIGIV